MRRLAWVVAALVTLPLSAQVIVGAQGGGGGSGFTPGSTTIATCNADSFVYADGSKVLQCNGPTYSDSTKAVGLNATTTIGGSNITGTAKTLIINNNTSTGTIVEIQDNGTPVIAVSDGGSIDMAGILAVNGTSITSGSRFDTASGNALILRAGVTSTSTLTLGLQGQLTSGGVAPAVSACGTSPTAVTGGPVAGRLTTGSGAGVQSCTLTFATAWAAAPKCIANNESAILLIRAVATTTTLVIDSAVAGTLASQVLTYICVL